MNKIKKNTFLYDLTKAQEIAYIQYKYCFHKESMNVVLCLFIKQQLDYELFLKAFNVEIQRNDCLRLFYVKKDGKLKQYFSEPYEIGEIERVDFTGKTKADQDEFFKKDASKPVCFFKDELFRIKLIKTYDGRTGIYFAVPHMNMDAVSVFMFYKDLLNVYTALRDNTEMPKPFSPFTEYIEKEKQRLSNKEKTDKDEQFFRELFLDGGEPLYVAVDGPESLEKLRKKRRNPELRSFPINNPFMDKSENIKFSLNPGLSEKMDRYCADHNTTPVFVLQNAVRAYAQKKNNGTEDFFFCSICNMRATLADKNTSGTMANGLMVRTMIKAETKYSDSVVLTGEAIS